MTIELPESAVALTNSGREGVLGDDLPDGGMRLCSTIEDGEICISSFTHRWRGGARVGRDLRLTIWRELARGDEPRMSYDTVFHRIAWLRRGGDSELLQAMPPRGLGPGVKFPYKNALERRSMQIGRKRCQWCLPWRAGPGES
jgi:hypothetical protein